MSWWRVGLDTTQVEVPDRKSICPDRTERTRWRRAFKITRSGKENERTIVWTYAILNARLSGHMHFRTHDSLDICKFERTIVWT